MGASKWHLATSLLCLIVALTSCKWGAVLAAPGKKAGDAPGDVFSLLHLGENSKLWDSDLLLKTLDDLRLSKPGIAHADALEKFVEAENLAEYLSLELLDAIYLPVPLNLIFIGFDGNGQSGLRLGSDELEHWFGHMGHILEHTRLPPPDVHAAAAAAAAHGGLTAAAGGAHAAPDQLRTTHKRTAAHWSGDHDATPSLSSVYYNYSIHAFNAGPDVAKVFQRALHLLSRPEDPAAASEDAQTMYQVDVQGMERLMKGLLKNWNLEDSYSIFVLNLRRNETRERYGYRLGLSKEEVAALTHENDTLSKQLLSKDLKNWHVDWPTNFVKRPLLLQRHSFAWKDVDPDNVQSWVKSFTEALDEYEKKVGKADGVDLAFKKAQEILTMESSDSEQLISGMRAALSSAPGEESGWQADCRVDAWVATQRFAFLDLAATSCSWGPQVGGEGVRSNSSLPATGWALEEEKDVKMDHELEQELQEMAEERFEGFDEDAGHDVDMLMAELDVYETFWEKHCEHRTRRLAVCKELHERLTEMADQLVKLEQGGLEGDKAAAAAKALHRLTSLPVFGTDGGHAAVPAKTSAKRDAFLSDLAAVLSSAMRHIITPTTATGGPHFSERVMMQIYLVDPRTKSERQQQSFDIASFMEQLRELELPGQHFEYTKYRLFAGDDAALAMAYASSLRQATLPYLDVQGHLRPSQRQYIDSAELEHQLSMLTGDSPAASVPVRHVREGSSAREVPVFIFMTAGAPMFLDKHHLAVSRPSMVLAVASPVASWRSHLHCNGWPIHWDLRQPVKAAVAAVARHLGGLLPTHVTYSPAHRGPAQDWLWSTGHHPFSALSPGWSVSRLHVDALARSYVANALDQALDDVNAGIMMLHAERTKASIFGAFKKLPLGSLMQMYDDLIGVLQGLSQSVGECNWQQAMSFLPPLANKAANFHAMVEAMTVALHPVRCMRTPPPLVSPEGNVRGFLAGGFILIAIAVYLVLRPRRRKPKIN